MKPKSGIKNDNLLYKKVSTVQQFMVIRICVNRMFHLKQEKCIHL